MAYFLHAMPLSPDKLRQERELQPVCKRCKNKHCVVPEEGISCCPLDDIRFIKKFYTKKINIPVTNIILGKHELELHVDPELFFFEKTFPLQVFEKIPFPMVCKLIDKKDVYDLYERLLAHSSIKINSLANLISMSIILDHLKLFLSYPKPVQTQLLSLRNKTVLENLKRDSTKSKGTHFLEFFLTIMNRCWVHNKELNMTIGVFDWTNVLEHKVFPNKPYMKIKGKRLQVPFPFKEDSNMEYIHPYKRSVSSENPDRGVITRSEKCLRWIDGHWISHPISLDFFERVLKGEPVTDIVNESAFMKNKKATISVNPAITLTQAQMNLLIKAMYTAQCDRLANGKEEQYYSTFMSNKFIEPKAEVLEETDGPVPTFEFTTASIPATAEQPAFNPTFAYLNSSQPVEEGESIMHDEVSGTYLVEAFQNFQNQMASSQNSNTASANETSSGDPTVFIPYPLPAMMRRNKQPYDENSTDDEKKQDYLEFIEKNYGTNARDVVFKQLSAVGKQQNNQPVANCNEIANIIPKTEISDDESSVDSLPLNDEEIQDCLKKLGKQIDDRSDLSKYVIRKKKVTRRVPVKKPEEEEDDLGLCEGIKAYFQTSTETYFRRERARRNGIPSPEKVEYVDVEEYVEETVEEAAEAWYQDIVRERASQRSSSIPMTKKERKKDAKELEFLKKYTYDVESKKRLIAKNMRKGPVETIPRMTNGSHVAKCLPTSSTDTIRHVQQPPEPRQQIDQILYAEIQESLERGRRYQEHYIRQQEALNNPHSKFSEMSYSSYDYPPVDGFTFPLNPATASQRDYDRCYGVSYYERYRRQRRSPEIVRLLLENGHIFGSSDPSTNEENKVAPNESIYYSTGDNHGRTAEVQQTNPSYKQPAEFHRNQVGTQPQSICSDDELSLARILSKASLNESSGGIDRYNSSAVASRSGIKNDNYRNAPLDQPLSPLPGSTASEQTSVMASSACGEGHTQGRLSPIFCDKSNRNAAFTAKCAESRLKATAVKRHITHNNTTSTHHLPLFGQDNNADVESPLHTILPLKFTPTYTRQAMIESTKSKNNEPTSEKIFSFGFKPSAPKDTSITKSSQEDTRPPIEKLLPFCFGTNSLQQAANKSSSSQKDESSAETHLPYVFGSSALSQARNNLFSGDHSKNADEKPGPIIFGASTTKQKKVFSNDPMKTEKNSLSNTTPFSYNVLGSEFREIPNIEEAAPRVSRSSGFTVTTRTPIVTPAESEPVSEKSTFLFGSQFIAGKNQNPLYVETSTENQSSSSNAWSTFIQASNVAASVQPTEPTDYNHYAFPYGLLSAHPAGMTNTNPLNPFGLLAPQQPAMNANPFPFSYNLPSFHQPMAPNYMFPFGINPYQHNSWNTSSMFPFGNPTLQHCPFSNVNTENTEGVSPYSVPPYFHGTHAYRQAMSTPLSNSMNPAMSYFNRPPYFTGSSPFQNFSAYNANTQNVEQSSDLSLLATLMSNANILTRTAEESSDENSEEENQKLSKTGKKRKFPFQRRKKAEFSEMTKALLDLSEKEFVELVNSRRMTIMETIEAINTGIPEVKRIIMTGSQDSDCYEDWKKTNEDFIARFKFNALYLLDQLEIDK